jgi:hypothetical protein
MTRHQHVLSFSVFSSRQPPYHLQLELLCFFYGINIFFQHVSIISMDQNLTCPIVYIGSLNILISIRINFKMKIQEGECITLAKNFDSTPQFETGVTGAASDWITEFSAMCSLTLHAIECNFLLIMDALLQWNHRNLSHHSLTLCLQYRSSCCGKLLQLTTMDPVDISTRNS